MSAARPTRFVALFRAINVGGRSKVAMADLRALADGLGLASAATILQTGNLVFEADVLAKTAALERRIEDAARKDLGLETDVMVRGAVDWAKLVDQNPYAEAAKADPAHLVLLVCKDEPAEGAQGALEAAIKGREEVWVVGRAAYAVFRDGIGRSKLTPQVLERHLGTRATGRNWNSVLKIAAALSS